MRLKNTGQLIGIGMIALVMIGCSGETATPQKPSKYQVLSTISDDGYVCKGTACKNDWAKTQLWINKHSLMKMQIMSDYLIQTYNPTKYQYSFSASKEPMGNNSYKIKLEISGGSVYTQGSTLLVEKSLYYYLKTGKDLLTPIPNGMFWSSTIK